ncbi:MAG: sigma-54 dependent transcriptional regulator, partial [Desulfarculaceae bacterium]|jgi:two-component system response regulator AtoC
VADAEPPDPRRRIIGNTPEMASIFKTIGLISRNQATVLISGETGSGKELIARVIHESSIRKQEPFITVDCTTLVDNLLESELFGHERGAFTGAVEAKQGRLELAGRGTIFFDEVGDMPLSLQAKLLRFLEYREFTRVGGSAVHRSQARIIAATNQNLEQMCQEGGFRQDLLFRLKVVSIHVPPLRQRLSDLPELVQFFLGQINHELQTRVTRVEEEAMETLRCHTWPGNVRELRNVLTKSALESRGAVLLAEAVKAALSGSLPGQEPREGLRTLDEVENDHILRALSHAEWNITVTAQTLGISRPTLRRKMARYGIKRPH